MERILSVGLDDIRAVTFECGTCKTRITKPAAGLQTPPQKCDSCGTRWWNTSDLAQHVSTTGPALLSFVQALSKLRADITIFRVLLEFEEPGQVRDGR
jgi:hypothetical protein